MSYPMQWKGSTNPDVKSGVATYMVDGHRFDVTLPQFIDAMRLVELLDTAFQQGKRFAAQAMRSHVERALESSEREHGLL